MLTEQYKCYFGDGGDDDIDAVCELHDEIAVDIATCCECGESIAVGDFCQVFRVREFNPPCSELLCGVECVACYQLRVAIDSVEADDGFQPHVRYKPIYGRMYEDLSDEPTDNIRRYLDRAALRFPGIESRSVIFRNISVLLATVRACDD